MEARQGRKTRTSCEAEGGEAQCSGHKNQMRDKFCPVWPMRQALRFVPPWELPLEQGDGRRGGSRTGCAPGSHPLLTLVLGSQPLLTNYASWHVFLFISSTLTSVIKAATHFRASKNEAVEGKFASRSG